MHTTLVSPRRQRGTTLLETLIAFVVFSLGTLAVARLQTHLRLDADIARQRSEAVRLAQEEIELLRAFAVLAAPAGTRSYDAIDSGTNTVDSAAGFITNTRYVVTRAIDPAAPPHAKNASVEVRWTDRSGMLQHIALDSIIGGSDPAYSGALGLARSALPMKAAFARSVRIPAGAKDLGDGTSVLKPSDRGTVAFVFDNDTGLIVRRCATIDAAVATHELTSGDLASCNAIRGYLLSGIVRFSSTSPPDAARSHDAPLDASVALSMTGGPYAAAPDCAAEPVAAGGDRYLAYLCAVYPSANGQWSGTLKLAPSGWSIGLGAHDHRVCRFASDLDGSGAIDANIEHPARYSAVDSTLANQNFLVIHGTDTCPTARPVRLAGTGTDVFVDVGTVQHQP